jgi:DNA-binding response OmpR family regulator
VKILIVEDNHKLLDAIAESLIAEKFLCETADHFSLADEKVFMHAYDILIVDINLPGGSGLDLIREMRTHHPATGIIVISARNSLDNKIEGLELGADDYLTKPFDMAELVARVKSLLRRRNFMGAHIIAIGDISIDVDSREVTASDTKIELTRS